MLLLLLLFRQLMRAKNKMNEQIELCACFFFVSRVFTDENKKQMQVKQTNFLSFYYLLN